MDGVPSPSPAGGLPDYKGEHVFILIMFVILPYVLLFFVLAALIFDCYFYRREPRQTTDIEAENHNHQQQQRRQPRPTVIVVATRQQQRQQRPVNSQQRPINSQRPPRPPAPKTEDKRIKEIAMGCTECVICLGMYARDENGVARRTLKPCGHRFHQACIDEWLKNGHGCPICRRVSQDSSVSVRGNRSAV